MGLFRARRTTVALDIGSGLLKLAEVGHGGDRPEVRKVAVRSTPPGAIADGEVLKPKLVAEAIGQLVGESGAGIPEVVAALGGHHVFVKKLQLARADGRDARSDIRREAERHIPFEIESVHLDFQMLDHREDASHMDVLVVAAKRQHVEERVRLLEDAGVGVVLLDVEAVALCNALVHNYPAASQGLVALVDCGHEATSINVLRDGVPLLARDHHFGLGQLDQSSLSDQGLSTERTTGILPGREGSSESRQVLEEASGVLAAGIERVTAVLRTRYPGIGLGRVFLSGGGACIPALAAGLGRRIKIETRVANPFEMVTVRTDAAGQALLAQAAPLFFLTLGLALRTA